MLLDQGYVHLTCDAYLQSVQSGDVCRDISHDVPVLRFRACYIRGCAECTVHEYRAAVADPYLDRQLRTCVGLYLCALLTYWTRAAHDGVCASRWWVRLARGR